MDSFPTAAVEVLGDVTAVFYSASSRKLLETVKQVARFPSSVLILGETGTGKELIARAIHAYSMRNCKPLVDVNCAALPEHLIESELFGYEKGAFSGADSVKPGFFELANGGSLFLDEIGELDPRMQVKLLRVLDGAPYYRLGGSRKVSVDVRIIAATNRDLEQEVRAGHFRSDLYHRLSQIQLRVPALRDRRDEIEAIVCHVLSECAPEVTVERRAMAHLQAYAWPGNVRELKNVITRLALTKVAEQDIDGVIAVQDLPPEIAPPQQQRAAAPDLNINDLDSMERVMIERALERNGGDQALAASQLGISRRTLSRKIKLYRLDEPAPAPPSPPPPAADTYDQHRVMRAGASLPVEIDVAGRRIAARTFDVSRSGIGILGWDGQLPVGATFDFRLALPNDGRVVTGRGRVIWADPTGRAGVQFECIHQHAESLHLWLTQQTNQAPFVPAAGA